MFAATISSAGLRDDTLTLTIPLGHRLQFSNLTANTSYTYTATVGAPVYRVYKNGTLFATPSVQFSWSGSWPRTISFSGAVGFTNPFVLDSGLSAAIVSFTPSDGLTETNVYEVLFAYSTWLRTSNQPTARIDDGLIVNTTQGSGASWNLPYSLSRAYAPTAPTGTSTLTAARASVEQPSAGAVTCSTLTASGGITGALGSVSCWSVGVGTCRCVRFACW